MCCKFHKACKGICYPTITKIGAVTVVIHEGTKFRSLFNQPRLGSDARKEAIKAIVNMVVESRSHYYTTKAHAS